MAVNRLIMIPHCLLSVDMIIGNNLKNTYFHNCTVVVTFCIGQVLTNYLHSVRLHLEKNVKGNKIQILKDVGRGTNVHLSKC